MQPFERPVVPEVNSSMARSPSAFARAAGPAWPPPSRSASRGRTSQRRQRGARRPPASPRASTRRRWRRSPATSATAAASEASKHEQLRAAQVERVGEHAAAERGVDRGKDRPRGARPRTAAARPPGSWAAAWPPSRPAPPRAAPGRGRAPWPRHRPRRRCARHPRSRRNTRPGCVAARSASRTSSGADGSGPSRRRRAARAPRARRSRATTVSRSADEHVASTMTGRR